MKPGEFKRLYKKFEREQARRLRRIKRQDECYMATTHIRGRKCEACRQTII